MAKKKQRRRTRNGRRVIIIKIHVSAMAVAECWWNHRIRLNNLV